MPPCFAPSLAWHPCCLRSLRSHFPPRRACGALRASALARCGRQGFGRCAPRFAPLRPRSFRAFARRPLGPAAGGWVWVPSRPCRPLPAGASAAPGGGGLPLVRFSGYWGCPVSALSHVSGFVPSLRSVFLSGRFRLAPWAGAALGLSFRRSRLSLSGFVAVVRFSSFPAALWFARCWGRRLPARPGFCVVRRVPGGFAVSVPVCPCLPPCRSRLRACWRFAPSLRLPRWRWPPSVPVRGLFPAAFFLEVSYGSGLSRCRCRSFRLRISCRSRCSCWCGRLVLGVFWP